MTEPSNYIVLQNEDKYSELSLWKKIIKFSAKAGKTIIHKALVLYFTVKDPDTPAWAKTVIYGVLGYFIMPLDSIPDIIPFVGFSDDLGAIVTAISVIVTHIKPSHVKSADEMLKKVFKIS